MANDSLNNSNNSINLSNPKFECALYLEQANAMVQVALTEGFREHEETTLYGYFTVVSDLLGKADKSLKNR